MAMLTSAKIIEYYDRYKSVDVTFTKEVVQVTRLVTQQVHLKCGSDFWPCVIFSSSFEGAKIVANIKTGILIRLERVNQMTNLRFCFRLPDSANPLAFFVNAKVLGSSPYGDSQDMAIFALQFTQRPPDDLIEIMGRILDANMNSTKRRNDRILITDDSARRMSLISKECATFIQGVPRRCIMRDISFCGAKLIMMGIPKFLIDKEVSLRMDFDDPRESFLLKGKFTDAETVEGRKDLVALNAEYDESLIPMGYKIRINDFLTQVRAGERSGEDFAPKPQPSKTAAIPKKLLQEEKPPEESSAEGDPEEAASEEQDPEAAGLSEDKD